MSTIEGPQITVVSLQPNTNEMVKFLAGQMDQLFGALAEFVPFTTGDIMSACLCHIVEAGKVGRGDDMDGLKDDLIQSVEVAIAHYSAPDKEKRN
jgi:hypothetical protein